MHPHHARRRYMSLRQFARREWSFLAPPFGTINRTMVTRIQNIRTDTGMAMAMDAGTDATIKKGYPRRPV